MFINTHSQYSLRYGTIPIKEIVSKAISLNISALVLTDINTSTGCLEFIRTCASENKINNTALKPIIGIEFRKAQQFLYVGIAKNKEGMRELNEFLTWHNLNKTELPERAPAFKHVFVIYAFSKSKLYNLAAHEFVGIRASQLNSLYNYPLKKIKEKLLVWHPITFSSKREYRLHEYLRAIDLNIILGKLNPTDKCEPTETWISELNLKEQFQSYEFIWDNTQSLLNSCSTDEYLETQKTSKNKHTYTKTGKLGDRILLRKLAYKGMAYRYGLNNQIAIDRINKELKVIEDLNFCAYFLITFDIIRYAIETCKFYHVGRGSGANSIVAYCLRITDVDPIELDLYFERFLNEKRTSPPDFDIDFAWDERATIQSYIFKRYPKGHVAFLGTMSTFKDRSVIREIGKVLGLPKEEIDGFIDPVNGAENQLNAEFNKILLVYELMQNMPNQRSIHAGGILISEEPITYYAALDLPPVGFPTVQWDMYEAESIGYEKFDILSQRGIGHIREAVKLVKQNQNIHVDIHDFKNFKNDKKVNNQLKSGDAIGCFYVESPAMRQLLKKLKCSNYLTLVAASSIIRPGVSSSGMMKTYIQNYHKPQNVQYLHPVMETQLGETFGVMVYQEDVIKICHHYAGLDLTDADILRRAMSGKFRSKVEFEKLVQRFFDKARALGRDERVTKEVWRQVSSFAGYSFSKAHSASFAVESYQSLYLKTYYPKEFMVAVLNNYGGFYPRWVYVHELKKTGAQVHLPCVNNSDETVNIRRNKVYLGFVGVQGLEQKFIELIPKERRENGPYNNLFDFIQRTKITLEQAVILVRLGALRFTTLDKKTLHWQIHNYLGHTQKNKIELELFKYDTKKIKLPEFENSKLEDAFIELDLLGYTLTLSMMELLITSYRGSVMANDLKSHIGKTVKMVGNYVCEKTVYTVKKTKMWFGTFIDAEGNFFDTVHFPNSTTNYPFRGRGCYLILGKVVDDFGFQSLEVIKFAKLPIQINPLIDFRRKKE